MDRPPTSNDMSAMVCKFVALIPAGRVMTYGQLAALAGHPRAARTVGQIAHWGPEDLPWHRVVNKRGKLAGEFPGGRSEQGRRLMAEGVAVNAENTIDIQKLLWWPQQTRSTDERE